MQETAPKYDELQFFTYDQYLQFEKDTGIRHEYVGGELYAMVGASRRHNEISGNIYSALRTQARGSGCGVYLLDAKLRVKNHVTYYPDVMVTCDSTDDDPLEVKRPCLVVEVLSPGTERTDRREKMISYSNMSSVQSYLIVSQDQQLVVRNWRTGSGSEDWETELHTSGSLPIPCPDMSLSLEDIYAE
jgi:Uma2 family endonuclease